MFILRVALSLAILSLLSCNTEPDASWFRNDGDTLADADTPAITDTPSDDTTPDHPLSDDTAPDDTDDTTLTGDDPHTDDPATDTEEPDDGSVISWIQQGFYPAGTTVLFEAVVTAVKYAQDDNYVPTGIAGIFVSETGLTTALPWSGIYLYLKNPAMLDTYARGDLIEVSGLYREYYDMSRIESPQIAKLGTAELPAPALIADPAAIATPFQESEEGWAPTTAHGELAEPHESVLITVESLTVTNSDLGFGRWEVTGGLVIDWDLHYYTGKRSNGTPFERITGILIYSFGSFKLAPRDAGDIAPAE